MTENERCAILRESRDRADGLIIIGGAYGLSDEQARRRQCIWLLADDGYLVKTGTVSYRLTSKGEDALEECEDESMLKPIKRAWTRYGEKVWDFLIARLTRG